MLNATLLHSNKHNLLHNLHEVFRLQKQPLRQGILFASSTTLKAHEYRYLTAPDGQSAILEASSHNPDIVLLDLGLPDMD